MKSTIAIAAASIVALAVASPAAAREGCGPGAHRTPSGMCRANQGTRARWIEDHYYPGRGYWAHNRWYQHRHRRNGVWVYM